MKCNKIIFTPFLPLYVASVLSQVQSTAAVIYVTPATTTLAGLDAAVGLVNIVTCASVKCITTCASIASV